MNTAYVREVPLELAKAAYWYRGGPPVGTLAGYGDLQLIRVGDSPSALVRKIANEDSIFGFTAIKGGVTHIVFRGTQTPTEWIDDFDAFLVPWEFGGMVHQGFRDLFYALRGSLPKQGHMAATGHSLGGALATLAAQFVKAPKAYTFGSPRTFDGKAAKIFNESGTDHTRIANAHDLVTHVAPRPLWEHCGSALILDGWSVAPSIEQKLDIHWQHSLEMAYGPCLAKLPADVPTVVLN